MERPVPIDAGAPSQNGPVVFASVLNGVSCSASLCVAVDGQGNAVTGVVVPPKNSMAPHITGMARDGRVLNAQAGRWSGAGPIRYTYQWRRCGKTGLGCTPIARATHVSYKLTHADVGHKISVLVTATNGGGDASAAASPVGPVAKPPAPRSTRRPSISGTVHKGRRLTATRGLWSSPDRLRFRRHWQRCSKTGSGCTNIRGAPGVSYKLTAADVGHKIRVVVTAIDQEFQSTAVRAAPVGPVRAVRQ